MLIVNGEYLVLSESLKKEGFKTAFQLGIKEKDNKASACSLVDIGCILDTLPDSLELMFNIIKIYIYDILFNHDDRSLENWGFCFRNHKIDIAIIDNEDILNPSDYDSVFCKFHTSLKYKELDIYEDFALFLQEYGFLYLKFLLIILNF